MAATKSYRIAQKNKLDSSSEEGELSSDDEIQVEISGNHTKMETVHPGMLQRPPSNGRKLKNIWTEVLADQSSNDISSSLGTVGMKRFMSRYIQFYVGRIVVIFAFILQQF